MVVVLVICEGRASGGRDNVEVVVVMAAGRKGSGYND